MYGGVAQRYILWKMASEPYKKGKYWYIKMEHPVTKFPTEVRWYTDKAHADLMPKPKGAKVKFTGVNFGFADKDDYVLCIRDRDLTKEEVEKYFHFNWKSGGKWRGGMFFGGVWYAPKDAEVPPIRRADHVFRATWPEFVKTGRANALKVNGGKQEGFWFEQEV